MKVLNVKAGLLGFGRELATEKLKAIGWRLLRRQPAYPDMHVTIGKGQAIYKVDRLSITMELSATSCEDKKDGFRYKDPWKNTKLSVGVIMAELAQVGKNRRIVVPMERLEKHVGPIIHAFNASQTRTCPTPKDMHRTSYDSFVRMEKLNEQNERREG